MDFYKIMERSTVRGRGDKKEIVSIDIYPDFIVGRSKDLMIRGKSVYAVWDQEKGLWSTDEYDVQRMVDAEMYNYRDTLRQTTKISDDIPINVLSMRSNKSKVWKDFKNYVSILADNFHQLDEKLTFLNTDVKKEDYVSRRLGYSLEEGDYSAWDQLVGTLYDEGEREKIEWAIGAVVSGDSKTIQKFCVFYGEAGTGKSTIINIIQKLFDGYYVTFDAKSLGSSSNQFATEAFRSNPLVAIQHDGDLSRIEDNTRINSIVSHEMMTVKEKFKPEYMSRANCFLFMGTNRPVKITDARSGIIRRLIDITPSGRKLGIREYDRLMAQIDFQLGAIAYHCLEVYKDLGKNYYRSYIPREMIMKTDVFYNFVEANLEIFEGQEGMTLKQAYSMYKEYCDDALVEFKLPRHKFREELKTYFQHFDEVGRVDGKQVRSWYSGFIKAKMEKAELKKEEKIPPMIFDELKDTMLDPLKDCPAQYATEDGSERPLVSWEKCHTKLKDIDSKKLHYILPRDRLGNRIPLVMIDFDLKNAQGEKDSALNLDAASKWPETYGEFSKGGQGVHLLYFYRGDLSKVASVFAPGIEIKTFAGNSSMRRRLSYCNNKPIAWLEEGSLPIKEEKMIDIHELKDQRHLVNKIARSLRKEDNVGGTKCEIDFIKKTLDDAYASGMSYDVSDMLNDILVFAMGSSHNSDYCVQQVSQMKLMSADFEEKQRQELEQIMGKRDFKEEDPIVFFDIEIYRPTEPGEVDSDGEENPGLFLICWKVAGEGQEVHAMVNPRPHEVEDLFRMKLVGFNNRDYDNHMIFARSMGYTNAQLYDLSKRIITEKARDAKFPQAYDLSYTDVFDFCAKKQGLKKWEIELGISHVEMGIPWDEPAPLSKWEEIINYCKNDVLATEAVFNKNKGDFIAREILADIAGGKVNDTTNTLTTRFIFGSERHPKLVYTDLATGERSDGTSDPNIIGAFPGYEYVWDNEKQKYCNMYRGIDVSKGGYVYSEKGIWSNVALLDIKSLHPHSAVALKYFGEYTQRFKDILDTRIAIKEKNFDKARHMFDGRLAKYLDDESNADALAQALKIAINSVYGLTSANFENPFYDPRNKNNIVALRGALFMKTLQDEVVSRGYSVAHIKTDSIKIPNATPEIISFCMEFAKKYGYEFDHEATYERMCLIDKAQYVAAYMEPVKCMNLYGYIPGDNKKHFKKHSHPWTTTGDAFQHPYIFKTLFSGEPIEFSDRCETKTVKDAAIYLDLNEGYQDVTDAEKEWEKRQWNYSHPEEKPKRLNPNFEGFSDISLQEYISDGHHYQFIGRAGSFFPVRPGTGGGWLMTLRNGKYSNVSGGKGYRWLESESARELGLTECYDERYFDALVDGAIKAINEIGSFDSFIDLSSPYIPIDDISPAADDDPPWSVVPCGDGKFNTCMDCPNCSEDICKRGYSLANYFE